MCSCSLTSCISSLPIIFASCANIRPSLEDLVHVVFVRAVYVALKPVRCACEADSLILPKLDLLHGKFGRASCCALDSERSTRQTTVKDASDSVDSNS